MFYSMIMVSQLELRDKSVSLTLQISQLLYRTSPSGPYSSCLLRLNASSGPSTIN